jgi:hypothetical protein
MQDCKLVKVPILMAARLIVEQCPKTYEEIEDMTCVPYKSVVGSMMYVMVCTRPDISHAVGVLGKYISTLGKEHWKTIKRVFRYLCGTKNYSICYQGKLGGDNGKLYVHVFVGVDWAGYLDQRRSTNEYVFKMFSGEISWMSKK